MSQEEATAVLDAGDFIVSGVRKHITFRKFRNGIVYG